MDKCTYCGELEDWNNEELFWCKCQDKTLQPKKYDGMKEVDYAIKITEQKLRGINEKSNRSVN